MFTFFPRFGVGAYVLVRDPEGLALRGQVVRTWYACDPAWRAASPGLPPRVAYLVATERGDYVAAPEDSEACISADAFRPRSVALRSAQAMRRWGAPPPPPPPREEGEGAAAESNASPETAAPAAPEAAAQGEPAAALELADAAAPLCPRREQSALELGRLGPMILNADGSASRVTNWEDLTPQEQARASHRISERNQARAAKQRRPSEEVEMPLNKKKNEEEEAIVAVVEEGDVTSLKVEELATTGVSGPDVSTDLAPHADPWAF